MRKKSSRHPQNDIDVFPLVNNMRNSFSIAWVIRLLCKGLGLRVHTSIEFFFSKSKTWLPTYSPRKSRLHSNIPVPLTPV